MQLTDIRLLNQQLVEPMFSEPKELVSWMGAVQAQHYTMSKWAVGVRLRSGTVQAVDKALRDGEILRTHVMRPTWHLVAAEDIRWMLKLSARHIQAANESYARSREMEIPGSVYIQSNHLLEHLLAGNRSLTKQELEEEFNRAGVKTDDHRLSRFLMFAETEGVICSGPDKGNKPTYALLDERVPPMKELTTEDALGLLARKYFRSHSPASLQDFIWWSGLSATEARQAIAVIEKELIVEKYDSQTWFIHEDCRMKTKEKEVIHLLPAYDEYLISYKRRTDVLDLEHHPKAFTNNGLFYPVLLHNGKVVGTWKRTSQKKVVNVDFSFFETDWKPEKVRLETARNRYKLFLR